MKMTFLIPIVIKCAQPKNVVTMLLFGPVFTTLSLLIMVWWAMTAEEKEDLGYTEIKRTGIFYNPIFINLMSIN
jgi:hypothetical protein